jgi:hypothetical protein
MTDDEMRDLFARIERLGVYSGKESDPYGICDFISKCANVPYTKVVDICLFEEER